MVVKRALLVPANLYQSAGLVARDLLRDHVILQARDAVAAWRSAGDDVWADFGDQGVTAPELAARVQEWAPQAIEVWSPVSHRRTGNVLARALELQLGAESGIQHVTIEHVTPTLPCSSDPVVPTSPDSRWLRRQSQPGWHIPAVAPPHAACRRPSPLPPALHLSDDHWIDALGGWIATHWPSRHGAWRSLIHAHDARVHPTEAVYEGLHLRDRNGELLVNIL